MKAYILYSGSKGNSTLITNGRSHILIDAGGCEKNLRGALAPFGVTLETLSGILVTHEHTDHTKALFTSLKKADVPVFTNRETAIAICSPKRPEEEPYCLAVAKHVKTVEENLSYKIGDFTVTPFKTPHDSVRSFGYSVTDNEGVSFVYATDTGSVTEEMKKHFKGIKNAVIEANHDVDMLIANPNYPEYLKMRIFSDAGHLSNKASADFAGFLCENGAKSITLAHLSEENNRPDVAYNAVWERVKGMCELNVASQIKTVEVKLF